MRTLVLTAALAASAAVLAACTPEVKAPAENGVCYAVVTPEPGEKGEVRFNRLADNQPQMEACAARLEEMRLRFLRMGGSQTEVIGSYQGLYLFIDRAGVWQSQKLDGPRFFALARTGDGRLAVPGAIDRSPVEAVVAPPMPGKAAE
ncbi:hypothetical protein KOAAANKH_01481 [Brevundimonas sp. NIBR10]|uniref:hypothetical protein n=1 Tax=Brevundimonas sp. NIBR10 TaxID=3015997 RepID=UPI0022F14BA2|nr:hypothetical protein [Brevundimonas sp. NIBR10]WGM46609.1 hypothetical protein KOAAANKH_01481 [Brevundimonas sp. NIBR10]